MGEVLKERTDPHTLEKYIDNLLRALPRQVVVNQMDLILFMPLFQTTKYVLLANIVLNFLF